MKGISYLSAVNLHIMDQYKELEKSIFAALETYSNVHRGSGHFSAATTSLYEEARKIVLEYLGLSGRKNVIIFLSPGKCRELSSLIEPGNFKILSSDELGLSLGVRALVADREKLPSVMHFQAGGGTTRLVSPDSVIWAGAPDRYEAGTPAIINVIAFARALQLKSQAGSGIFNENENRNEDSSEILYHDEFAGLSGRELLDKLENHVIGKNISVPSAKGAGSYINLDYAATTPAFLPAMRTFFRSLHLSSECQKGIISEVKSICSKLLNAPDEKYDILFTCNATEAINLVSSGLREIFEKDAGSCVLVTLLEHNSNDLPWRMISGDRVERIGVDSEGFLDLTELERVLSDFNEKFIYGNRRIRLMAVSGASNVLGSFNDIPKISQLAHHFGVHLLVDGAQLISHREVDMEKWDIDYLVFSGHKAYAPFGAGVLVSKKGIRQMVNSEGEENVAGIAALGKSLSLLQHAGLDLIREKEQELTSFALSEMAGINGLKIHGIKDPASPRIGQRGPVIAFSMKKVWPDKIAGGLAWYGGIGIRYGCHCAHILIKHMLNVPQSLQRFQKVIARLFPGMRFPGVARISFGIGTTKEDILAFSQTLKQMQVNASRPFKKDLKKVMDEFTKARSKEVYSSH
jgi:selenocysteine lyase/cysteine desulfurase